MVNNSVVDLLYVEKLKMLVLMPCVIAIHYFRAGEICKYLVVYLLYCFFHIINQTFSISYFPKDISTEIYENMTKEKVYKMSNFQHNNRSHNY